MILYYSATGNTEYIAKAIAMELDDESLDLLDRIRRKDYSEIHSLKPFVICAPVYVCEMPFFLRDYLKQVRLTGTGDIYFVFTSGGYAGISGFLAKRLFRKRGMNYLGHAEFKMPRNYIASNMYPELDDKEVIHRIRSSKQKMPEISAVIQKHEKLRSRHVFLFEILVTLPFTPLWIRFRQPSEPFHTTDKCIGCGKCERLCPLNNISMKDGRPLWKHSCAHCMACICGCPAEAIEYGDITQTKKKYHLRKYITAPLQK